MSVYQWSPWSPNYPHNPSVSSVCIFCCCSPFLWYGFMLPWPLMTWIGTWPKDEDSMLNKMSLAAFFSGIARDLTWLSPQVWWWWFMTGKKKRVVFNLAKWRQVVSPHSFINIQLCTRIYPPISFESLNAFLTECYGHWLCVYESFPLRTSSSLFQQKLLGNNIQKTRFPPNWKGRVFRNQCAMRNSQCRSHLWHQRRPAWVSLVKKAFTSVDSQDLKSSFARALSSFSIENVYDRGGVVVIVVGSVR